MDPRIRSGRFAVLLLFACAGSYLIKMGSFFADVSSVILLILMCLGIMGVLWTKGDLFDELDQSIIRSLINKLFPSSQEKSGDINAPT